jgi:hypothetical protein
MTMQTDVSDFIKKLKLSGNFVPPAELVFEDIKAKPLTRQDLEADLEAVNSSLEIIRQTRGGSWPEEELNSEFDLLDLAWHEREFRDRESFAYVIYDTDNQYIGCFYLYPMGVRTTLTDELLKYDVDVSWWVTSLAYKQAYYVKLYNALKEWLSSSFPFENIYYSNKEIPS